MCLSQPGLCRGLGSCVFKVLIPRKALSEDVGSLGAGRGLVEILKQLVHALERTWTPSSFPLCPWFITSAVLPYHILHPQCWVSPQAPVNEASQPQTGTFRGIRQNKPLFFMSSPSQVFGYRNEKLANTGYRNKIPQNGELRQQTLPHSSEAESLRPSTGRVLVRASLLPSWERATLVLRPHMAHRQYKLSVPLKRTRRASRAPASLLHLKLIPPEGPITQHLDMGG